MKETKFIKKLKEALADPKSGDYGVCLPLKPIVIHGNSEYARYRDFLDSGVKYGLFKRRVIDVAKPWMVEYSMVEKYPNRFMFLLAYAI